MEADYCLHQSLKANIINASMLKVKYCRKSALPRQDVLTIYIDHGYLKSFRRCNSFQVIWKNIVPNSYLEIVPNNQLEIVLNNQLGIVLTHNNQLEIVPNNWARNHFRSDSESFYPLLCQIYVDFFLHYKKCVLSLRISKQKSYFAATLCFVFGIQISQSVGIKDNFFCTSMFGNIKFAPFVVVDLKFFFMKEFCFSKMRCVVHVCE